MISLLVHITGKKMIEVVPLQQIFFHSQLEANSLVVRSSLVVTYSHSVLQIILSFMLGAQEPQPNLHNYLPFSSTTSLKGTNFDTDSIEKLNY